MEHHLLYKDQLLLLKRRCIAGIDQNDIQFDKQVNALKVIGYYRLKQYAYVFWNNQNNCYEDINFHDLIRKYQKLSNLLCK
jgi:abortive infection bacteriophage resistance protein